MHALLNGVSEPLRELPKQVIASMDTKQLRMLLKPLAGWEKRLQISEHRMADARKFIDHGNLRIADAALQEFFKIKPDEYKPLSDWIGSGQGKSLSLGG